MLSSSRRCLGISKHHSTGPRDPFTEPFPFLYPRWFHAAAALSDQSGTISIARPQRAWTEFGQLSTRNSSGATIARSRFPRRVWTDLDGHSTPTFRADWRRVDPILVSRDEATDIPGGPLANANSSKNQRTPSTAVSGSRSNLIGGAQEITSNATPPPPTPIGAGSGSTGHALEILDYEPKLRIRRTSQSAFRRVLARAPESAAKTIKKEATKKLHDPAGIDWSEPIRLLARLIHRPKKVLGERLELHRNTVYHVTGSFQANAWFHPVRLGCEVRVLDEPARHGEKLVVILHGMPRARQLTKEYLLEMDRNKATSAALNLESEEPARIRFVLSSLAWHERTKGVCRADAVKQPPTWTVRSFADVVETLTTMQIPRQLRRELYDSLYSHNRTVAKVLEGLFTDPKSEPFISLRALNRALRFTCEHTELQETSDFLFEKAKSIGLSVQADTFNILIEQALRQNKLDYYRNLLATIQQMGVVPNAMTWVALLKVTKSRTARRAILRRIQQMWPKDIGMWQQVALELVTTDFARLVRLEKSFDYFVDFMDHSLPPGWLSARCINRMLHVCAERKLWDIVPRIFEFGERRGGFFNTATQTALLRVFHKRGSIRDSIDFLESHFAKTVGRDSAFAIPTVFMTAWHSRFYNVCRVLWRYAAVSGYITSPMQHAVAASLMRNNDASSQSMSHLWRITAGKVIVGTDLDLSGLASQFPSLPRETAENAMDVLAQWTPDHGPRQEQLSLAYIVMQRDLTAYKRFWRFPSHELFDLLRKAYEVDCEWMHQKRVRRYADLSWMINEAIQLPLQPLANPSVSPRHLLWPIGDEVDHGSRGD